jgi:AraC-like DNA-binding protein
MTQFEVSRQRIEGIDDMRRVLGGPNMSCVPLGSGVPKGRVLQATVGDVRLRAGELTADIRGRGDVDANAVSLSMKLDSASLLFSFRSGEECLPGDVYRLVRGDVSDYRANGRNVFAVISLSAEALLKRGGEEALREDVEFWERCVWFRASPAIRALAARSVARIALRLLQPGLVVTGAALHQLQHELTEPFVCGVLLDDRTAAESHHMHGAAIVRKVENWVDDQSLATIQIADLCRALHLSRRTLQRAFTETLGIGPARYLTLRRLAAVRSELRSSDPAAVTVTATALKHGFWELGRFARDYRHTFGERPSETLSRGNG